MATLERANEACNYLSRLAWDTKTFRQFSLHKLGYYDTRERFALASQMVIRCEAKVADAYKLDRETERTFRPHGAIAYDDRILKWKQSNKTVSIWTLAGRQEIPYQAGETQQRALWNGHKLLESQQGESDLVLVGGDFYLLATCNVPDPTPEDIEGYLGIDMGIVEIATDSLGTSYNGETVKRKRRKHRRLRKSLQKKGTKSAKRKLKKLTGKEKRFAKDVNHCVSKALVETAERNRLGIALENLKGIRGRVRASKAVREDLHSWAFHQLGQFLFYKALLAGLLFVEVDPRNTSRTCSVCGHCEKANRKSQAEFVCQACKYAEHADVNAARNIAARAAVKRPIVAGVSARQSGYVSKSAHAAPQLQAPSLK